MPFAIAPVMGTTVSIDVRDMNVPAAALDAAVAVLREIEARFSTFRPDSEISRIDRGELSLEEATADVRDVLAACARLRAESEGAFDIWRDRRLDPSGYVKGWAAELAADVMRAAGARNFTLNIGGDVVSAGERQPGQPWRIGIRHPDAARPMMAVVGIRDGAVATSGLYERGGHVTDPRTGAVADTWRSVTVIASDLTTADSIATAALARGEDGPDWAAHRLGCDVIALDQTNRLFTTGGAAAVRLM
jgi:FAD:protein FMN transferase